MAERIIVISRQQSELVDTASRAAQGAQHQLQLILSTLIAADGVGVPPSVNWECRSTDDVYQLVLQVPDIAPVVAEAPAA